MNSPHPSVALAPMAAAWFFRHSRYLIITAAAACTFLLLLKPPAGTIWSCRAVAAVAVAMAAEEPLLFDIGIIVWGCGEDEEGLIIWLWGSVGS